MRSKNFYYATLIVGITAVLTVGITVKLSRSRPATPVPPVSAAPLVARTTALAGQYRGAQKEGIRVHGHWTIEIRNPDGTLITHREFENSLIGQTALVQILARQATVGEWTLRVGSSSDGPCIGFPTAGVPSFCNMVEANSHQTGPTDYQFNTLTLAMQGSDGGPTPPGFVMSGTATARREGTIDTVRSEITRCDPTVLPANCFYPGNNPVNGFTHVQSSSGQFVSTHVKPGQIIQATLVISFS